MIKIIEGDLLKAKQNIIGHQVNCFTMGSGVAAQIRNKFPKAFSEHQNICQKYGNNEILLGLCQIVCVRENKYVANLFGQFNYGYDGRQYTNLEHLENALSYLAAVAKKHNKTVALPYKIGSDRGGANWDEVYKIIEKSFEEYEVTLYRRGD